MLDWARFRSRDLETALTAWWTGSESRMGWVPWQDGGGTYIFLPKLVGGQAHGAVRAAAYLVLDDVLVDAVLGLAIRVIVCVLGPRIEGFLREVL